MAIPTSTESKQNIESFSKLQAPAIHGDYVGRFAPSPSGPLHFGSLVCALASYIDAKKNSGRWLVRIEDIDPLREQPGASDAILKSLETHGLRWDGEVRYQSQRSQAYREVLDWLKQQDLTYRCNCTRKRLEPLNGVYDGYCRGKSIDENELAALRLKVSDLPSAFQKIATQISFVDGVKGKTFEDLAQSGDFIIHRKDGYFAYQLAVVVDDIDQRVTRVVRGDDLLDTTGKQIYLYHLLGKRPPHYAHIPVILDKNGNKLSKQNHAPELNLKHASHNLVSALKALNIPCIYDERSEFLPLPIELLEAATFKIK